MPLRDGRWRLLDRVEKQLAAVGGEQADHHHKEPGDDGSGVVKGLVEDDGERADHRGGKRNIIERGHGAVVVALEERPLKLETDEEGIQLRGIYAEEWKAGVGRALGEGIAAEKGHRKQQQRH